MPLTGALASLGLSPARVAKPSSKLFFAPLRATRSCGRFGPASEGSTVARSSSSMSVNTGSAMSSWRHMPCALA